MPIAWNKDLHVARTKARSTKDALLLDFNGAPIAQPINDDDGLNRNDIELSIVQPTGVRQSIHERGALNEQGQLRLTSGISKNIAERAEDDVQRSGAYLAESQKLSRTGSFGWNVSTGQVFWSEEAYRIA